MNYSRLISIVITEFLKSLRTSSKSIILFNQYYVFDDADDIEFKIICNRKPKLLFDIDANTDLQDENFLIHINIDYDTNLSNQIYNKLYFELYETITHELVHVRQYSEIFPVLEIKNIDINNKYLSYFLDKNEIPAFVIGFNTKAGKLNIPFKSICNEYLKFYMNSKFISLRQKDFILDNWMNYHNLYL